MDEPIKILFLAATPKDTNRLRLDEEMRGIDLALRQSEFRDKFDIRQHWAVRVIDLQSYFLRHKPDIVHFSGHGSLTSEIILEDNAGESHPISNESLSQLFSVLKDNIRCVILNACYSERQAQAIAKHIDCVIGMSRFIGDSSAINFAVSFYQALGYGRNVKTAFELGCGQIDLENLSENDTPKLLAFNCNPDKVVFVHEVRSSSDNPKTRDINPATKDSSFVTWTPHEYAVLITIGTACLCLIILVLGTVLGVLNGAIPAYALGKAESAGFGGGLLGLSYILYRIIRFSLGREAIK